MAKPFWIFLSAAKMMRFGAAYTPSLAFKSIWHRRTKDEACRTANPRHADFINQPSLAAGAPQLDPICRPTVPSREAPFDHALERHKHGRPRRFQFGKRRGELYAIAAREQDYEFEAGRLRGGHYYLDGPQTFKALKVAMSSAYGPPSWRGLDQVSQGYGWEWKTKGVLVEARYDLTKETTTVTLQRSNPSR